MEWGGTMKRILVAVDGSEHSMKAVDTAAEMAAGAGVKLSLLAVVPSAAAMADELEVNAIRRLAERAAQDSCIHPAGIPTTGGGAGPSP
jgi:nucleotide-binding universal stress UspA family protein